MKEAKYYNLALLDTGLGQRFWHLLDAPVYSGHRAR
jgi:hypothetical protein